MHGILFFPSTNLEAWESGYCAINVDTGSLVYAAKSNIAQTATAQTATAQTAPLVPDLRGCSVRIRYDTETQAPYLDVATSSGLYIQLRILVPEKFDP